MAKRSFFSRLTGNDTEYDDDYFGNAVPGEQTRFGEDTSRPAPISPSNHHDAWSNSHNEPQGELAVDVYQTQDAIVVKALVAGVLPTSIDIALTREMLTITGSREDEREVSEDNYFHQELYWGSFSRTILLPEEVDVDAAEASEKHGILMIRLPKINKKKETKLRVRSK